MRILLWTDPHVTRACEFASPTLDGYNEYISLVEKSFDFVCEQIEIQKPDLQAFNGDFYDGRDYVDTMALSVGAKIFHNVSKPPVKYRRAIPGNHDYFSVEHGIHSLGMLRSMGWEVFDEPTVETLEGHNLLWIPFRDTYDLNQLRDLIGGRKIDVAFTHMDVVGAKRRAARHEKDTKAFSENGVPPSFFADCGIVFNGHYHHPSQVTENFFNVGSLTARTFHDQGSEPRGIAIYDTITKEYKRIANPYARQFMEIRIENEEQLATVLDTDRGSHYAKIYYSAELESQVRAVQDAFAGSRLLPLAPVSPGSTERGGDNFDLKFSLEENLVNYMKEFYPEDDALAKTSLEVFFEAVTELGNTTGASALEFGDLEIQNYQSIGHIKISLHQQGLVFVQGLNDDDPGQDSNGAGKSSLVEAPYWCLTGKSLRGLTGDDIINWTASFTRVSVEIIKADGKYKVIRCRKDPEFGSGAKLFKDGVDISPRLSEDVDSKIRDVLGRSDENLKHTCFLVADMSSRFSKLSHAQRAQLLEEVIDSTPYKQAQLRAKKRAELLFPEQISASAKMDTLTKQIAEEEDRKGLCQVELKGFDEVNARELAQINEQCEKATVEATEAAENAKKLLASATAMDEEIEILEKKLAAMDVKRTEQLNRKSNLGSRLAVIVADIGRYNNLHSKEMCPTCEEPVHRSKVVSRLSTLNGEKHGFEQQIKEVGDEVAAGEERMWSFKNSIKQRRDNKVTLNQLAFAAKDRESAAKQKIEAVRARKIVLASSKSNLESHIRTIDARIDAAKLKFIEVSATMEDIKKRRAILETLQSEVFAESGVRNALLARVAIPYINARLPEYALYLLGGQPISLSGDRELKNRTVKKEIEIELGKRKYKSNSSGEKRRVDLPLQFAIGDLAAACGHPIPLLFVDEVLDPLDESGVYGAKEILRKRAETSTILMVSHSKYAASITPRKIVLRKSGDRTELLALKTDSVMGY